MYKRQEYDCSRNTVRRAIGRLAGEGYVQSLHGKGVRVIYQPGQPSEFMLSGIESLKEAVARNRKEYSTKVVCLDVYKRQGVRRGGDLGQL